MLLLLLATTIKIRQIRMALELILIKLIQELTLIRITKAQMDNKLTIHFPSPSVHQNSRPTLGITVVRAYLKTSMILSSE